MTSMRRSAGLRSRMDTSNGGGGRKRQAGYSVLAGGRKWLEPLVLWLRWEFGGFGDDTNELPWSTQVSDYCGQGRSCLV